jgi:cell wall-associated NlpC family hydrolase
MSIPLFLVCGAVALLACGPNLEEQPDAPVAVAVAAPGSAAASAAPDACPAELQAPQRLPGTRAEHETLAYWTKQLGARYDLDAPLLSPADVQRINAAATQQPHGPDRRVEDDLRIPLPAEALLSKVRARLNWMRGRIEAGKYLHLDGQPLNTQQTEAFRVPAGWQPGAAQIRVALEPLPIRCGASPGGLYTTSLDPAFDRNNCSTAHPQEPVEILGAWPNGMWLVRTRYALGWLPADAALSPALTPEDAQAFLSAPRLQATQDTALSPQVTLTNGRFVASQGEQIWFADAAGLHLAPKPATLRATARTLTRRALLEEAFRWLNAPYGWGGQSGGRDCSRLLLDVFATFGLELPRFSGHQPHTASFVVPVASVKDEGAKLRIIDEAARQGVVLLHFPGHIMLYLGRDADGTPMALHSFAEYLVPCPKGVPTANEAHETLMRVHRVTVSDLELGRGSSRTAFVERITHIAVLGAPPNAGLRGLAVERPAAPVVQPKQCRKGGSDFPVFVGPSSPNSRQPLRLIAAPMTPPGPVALRLIAPDGTEHHPALRRLNGPPYTLIAQIPEPQAGRWTALWGDGDRSLDCRTITVRHRPEKPPKASGVWPIRNQWGPRTEALYAAFVESLFDYPTGDTRTWSNLHTLLADPDRNLLFGHLGLNEDAHLKLVPDCADLPYFLRAYFAWKLGLPFGFRQCSRGRAGRPPSCGELMSTAMAPASPNPVKAAQHFIRRKVKGAVHSSTARTLPDDEDTDLYPVPLSREAIRPGTTYADPYGHLLVVVSWIPQTAEGPGRLIAADAQPDGTIGRRRFWRGSFLFTAETKSVGAGFKAFRPVFAEPSGEVVARDNAYLAKSRTFPRLSQQQYAKGDDAFYDGMQALINPRPLDPFTRQSALVDALHEVVGRRVLAVQNGEDFQIAHRFKTMKMPRRAAIFLTAGPWEDFATPSRDMRLLISLHTVLDFAASVRRAPESYGLKPAEVADTVRRIEQARDTALAAKSIEYVDSNGQPFALTLADVVARRTALEMAYNPNDCVEIRWGAPEGSDELKTCARRAPRAQLRKMTQYRPWFSERRRPGR